MTEFELFVKEHEFERATDTGLENEHRSQIHIRYAGMGWYTAIGVDPTIVDDKRYFVGKLGGSNGYDAKASHERFQRIGLPGTKYFSLAEFIEIEGDPEVDPGLFCAASVLE